MSGLLKNLKKLLPWNWTRCKKCDGRGEYRVTGFHAEKICNALKKNFNYGMNRKWGYY